MSFYCPKCRQKTLVLKKINDEDWLVCENCQVYIPYKAIQEFNQVYTCIEQEDLVKLKQLGMDDIYNKTIRLIIQGRLIWKELFDIETGRDVKCLDYKLNDSEAKLVYFQLLQIVSKWKRKGD